MDLGKCLALWANCDDRKDQLVQWLDAAIIDCATSGGQTVASSTTNGVAVTFMTNSLTLEEWITALTMALQIINNPNTGKRKATLIFR